MPASSIEFPVTRRKNVATEFVTKSDCTSIDDAENSSAGFLKPAVGRGDWIHVKTHERLLAFAIDENSLNSTARPLSRDCTFIQYCLARRLTLRLHPN